MGAIDKTQDKPHTTPYKAGDTVVCTYAASSAFVKHKLYEIYKNDKGWKCMLDKDGTEHICGMVLSVFKVATDAEKKRSEFKVI